VRSDELMISLRGEGSLMRHSDLAGRPIDRSIDPENADRIKELLETEPYFPQKILSKRWNLRHDTVHRIVREELGLCKVNFK
jgi:hypothetical protein